MMAKTSNKGNVAGTAKSLAKTMRKAPKNASLSPDQSRSSKPAVSGKVANTVAAKRSGTASTPAQRRQGVTRAKAGYESAAPKVGRRTAVSGTVETKFGTARAKNNSSTTSTKVISNTPEWGKAPARNQGDLHRPYGT